MSTSVPLSNCIPSNPDITGIGIRISIYGQNLLNIMLAFCYALQDEVTPTELGRLETQSFAIFITAFAFIFSAIIQTFTRGITPYHGAIVLNMSWMNNTSLCIYYLVHSKVREKDWQLRWKDLVTWWQTLDYRPLLWIGSVHLTLMSFVGLFLWSKPADFGTRDTCSLSTSIFIIGLRVKFNAPGLKIWSLFIYGLIFPFGLNLVFPALFSLLSRLVPRRVSRWVSRRVSRSVPRRISRWVPVGGLALLGVINIILIYDIEKTIEKNKLLLQSGDGQWTFGQTLAFLLLLLPLLNFGIALYQLLLVKNWEETFLDATKRGDTDVMWVIQNRVAETVLDQALVIATENGQPKAVATLIKAHAGKEVKNRSMIIAVREGQLKIVKLLVDKGAVQLADVKDLAGYSLTFLAAKNRRDDVLRYLFEKEHGAEITNHWSLLYIAAKRKERDIVQLLLINDYDVNEKGPIGETVLHCLAQEENIDLNIFKMLIKYADTNAMDFKGYTALHYAVKAGSINSVELLLKHHADVNVKCSETILLCANESGNTDIIQLLLNAGAKIMNNV